MSKKKPKTQAQLSRSPSEESRHFEQQILEEMTLDWKL